MHKIKMAYNREEVCGHGSELYFTYHFLVKGTAPGKKKLICAKMKIILKPILSYACLLKKKKMLKKSGFSKIIHIIVAMYFTTFEGLIVYRNTRRPCYVSKRAYSCRVGEF